MEFTNFGKKMTCKAGILSLMDDLGKAAGIPPEKLVMMGGGNPGQVPQFQEIVRNRLLDICETKEKFQELVGSYAPPQGEGQFVDNIASLLRREFGWQVTDENICLTNGSQTAFFMLFNLFAGRVGDGSLKKICLPLAPEYIGYADLGLEEGLFISFKPNIEVLEDPLFFKYRVDFNALELGEDVGALCVSRPTNPTGNVVTDEEIKKLLALAKEHDIPLIVDSAYGLPFPGMIYEEANPVWDPNVVVCLSLSKLGLPAVRTGIVIAAAEVVEALTSMNAIMSLSPTSIGAMLTKSLMESGEILSLSREVIGPFYRRKMELAVATVREVFAGLPCKVHVPEGAMFLWLWFENLPISSLELYSILKDRGVLVVSGHYFYPGLAAEWQHRNECIRVTYSQQDKDVCRGLQIIGEVVREIYHGADG